MIINTDLIYPIGAIYLSVSATNPTILFGGKWEQIKDRFLLAAGDTYNAGSTGGEATHILTPEEMPSHTHTQKSMTNPGNHTHNTWKSFSFKHASGGVTTSCTGESSDGRGNPTAAAGGHTHTVTLNNTGGGVAHNNMPPYLTVYMWKRVA